MKTNKEVVNRLREFTQNNCKNIKKRRFLHKQGHKRLW